MNTKNTTRHWPSLLMPLLMACTCALTACGGGGSSSPATRVPPAVPAASQPAQPQATPVGAPSGDQVSQVIGTAGGELSTADGRLTVIVPPGAFTRDETLRIEAIGNQAHGGLGQAYRITPEGLHTTVPMSLRFQASDAEWAAMDPTTLDVAYQDGEGLWHALRQTTRDMGLHRITVQTTHFSDWSMVAGVQLRPPEGKVALGKTLTLEVMSCEQAATSATEATLYACQPWDPAERTLIWSVNGQPGGNAQVGTAVSLANTPTRSDAVYTAPVRLPQGNTRMVAAVSAEIFNTQQPETPTRLMVSNILVEDPVRSCEWLRSATTLDFDIDLPTLSYQSSDDDGVQNGQHTARMSGRLVQQAQSEALGWWIAEPSSVRGQVSVNDGFDGVLGTSTVVGNGTPFVDDGRDNPDGARSAVVMYVDFARCTYRLTAGFAVMATVTEQAKLSETPPTVTTKPVALGTLGLDETPLLSTFATVRAIYSERVFTPVPEIGPGVSAYAPARHQGSIQTGSGANVIWTLKAVD